MVVATVSVGVFAFVGVIGLDLEFNREQLRVQQDVASHTAAAAAVVYIQTGSWGTADLEPALTVAERSGAVLVVRDAGGEVVAHSPKPERYSVPGTTDVVIDHPVAIDGMVVGSVELSFSRSVAAALGRDQVAWILGAATVALGVAAVAALLAARQVTQPLAEINEVGRRFAAGDHDARAQVDAPGEIGELARTLNDAADAVLEAELAQRNIAADVAHELRTPLAALQAGLEEMRDGLLPADAASLTRLHDQATRMGLVVGELAALSSAEAAPRVSDNTQVVDLAAVAEAEMAAREPLMRSAGLTVVGETQTALVRAETNRLHEIVGNLLANSAKYCRAGDQVTVVVYQRENRAVLRVADTGPGIPAEELPHVFDRFWRGAGGSGTAGSGLGLAIVKALVAAQAGSVDVESRIGAGTTFRVEFPLVRPSSDGGWQGDPFDTRGAVPLQQDHRTT
jgi:two-component system sensor histidine kinase BaeS